MIPHSDISAKELRSLIRSGKLRFGGNRRLKIYGRLQCGSGKKMKRENRLFFGSEQSAKDNGYRPCGHCMREEYRMWKAGEI
ncbi:Ada metal-binding domain-containing protein [Chitinophaga barathri]|uniref:Metal-binding protein n=1 Tax=Chitinophaga barathri TaxID=1647451 RepID=A0A3N4M934_9BACT|nr:Ada metal-binding domain-containing protein [Chitinophaga barathri]RPD39805.1 metal-binding protein [Chitinophaga barathri]